jgi:hypothetical protein
MRGLIVLWLLAAPLYASNIDISKKFAWSETIGWLDFADSNGGVTVYDDHLEGFVWASNIGWIRLGTHTGGGTHRYENSQKDNYGVNVNPITGELSGYAWSEVAGWLNFNAAQNQKVTINVNTGQFSGYAWGENIGWVSFNTTEQYALRTSLVLATNSQTSPNNGGAGRMAMGGTQFGKRFHKGRYAYNPWIQGELINEGLIENAEIDANSDVSGDGLWSGNLNLAHSATLHDTNLQAGTVVRGGRIGGVINGEHVSKSQRKVVRKALLEKVKILANTVLKSVVIGKDVELPKDLSQLSLGEGVEFLSKELIPAQLELLSIFSHNGQLDLDMAFIQDQNETLKEKINQIKLLADNNETIEQVGDGLRLISHNAALRFEVKPRSLQKTTTRDQVLGYGSFFSLFTPEGFALNVVPAVQDLPLLKTVLQLTDEHIHEDDWGNLWLTLGENAPEAVVRGRWGAEKVNDTAMTTGLYSELNVQGLPLFYLISLDEQGQLWKQVVYPAAADLLGLQWTAKDVQLDEWGQLSFDFNGQRYQGFLSYLTQLQTKTGELSVDALDDGSLVITYPNGYQQTLYH